MRFICRAPVVRKRCCLAARQLAIPNEEVNGDAALLMLYDLLASLALRRCRVLALPVEVVLVDPVVQVLVSLGLTLLVQGHQQYMRLLAVQCHVAHVPATRVERLAQQRGNLLSLKALADGQV